MEIFRGQNLIEFAERFKTDEDCKKYLSEIKWAEHYVCRKCGHTKSQVRKDFSRTCKKPIFNLNYVILRLKHL